MIKFSIFWIIKAKLPVSISINDSGVSLVVVVVDGNDVAVVIAGDFVDFVVVNVVIVACVKQ